MGLFMQSVSFRRPKGQMWWPLRYQIERVFEAYDLDTGLAGLEEEREAYGLCDLFEGGLGPAAEEFAQEISKITGDYVITAECVDSDFALVALYHAGRQVDAGCIGEPYEEVAEFGACGHLNLERWLPLLSGPGERGALEKALFGEFVFAEDQLRELTRLTGMPVFDEEALLGPEEDF